jgi:hypothetical protein
MNARKSIITVGAVIALVIPSAAGARMVSENAFQVAKETGVMSVNGQAQSARKSHTAKSSKTLTIGVSGYSSTSSANLR